MELAMMTHAKINLVIIIVTETSEIIMELAQMEYVIIKLKPADMDVIMEPARVIHAKI
jgi:hypothetical protein